jgi:rare lipoprotein A (peptidoglycan hydrolase)
MRSHLLSVAFILSVFSYNSFASEVTWSLASVDFGDVTQFDGEQHQGLVATGEQFQASRLAVAHRTLPLNSCVAVYYEGRTQTAVVNDRGPCSSDYCQRVAPARVKERVLDMTPAGASLLKFPGLGRVAFWPIECGAS